MSHPIAGILEDIFYDQMTDMEADGDVDTEAVFELHKARASAVLEARDLAVATAVRNACEKSGSLSWEAHPFCIRAVDLKEIIKGVK